MKDKLLITALFILVTLGVAINVNRQLSVDRSRIPDKVEQHNGFQRWITNVKNKGLDISADEFLLIEENEIYNTRWMKVYSLDDEKMRNYYQETLEKRKDIDKVIFSPSERLFIDYRDIKRGEYRPNDVHFLGVRDDKIIDARILDCEPSTNCYFDRAYFLDNDVFVISEFSRNIDKKADDNPPCDITEICEYTIKLHVIDLVNNSRLVYASKPFNIDLSKFKPEL